MTKLHKKELYAAAAVSAVVVIAVAARIISNAGYFTIELGLVRTTLYIFLFLAWGISVRQRVIQAPVRRYLTAVAGLMIFWFVVRTIKYFFATDVFICRRIWYLYYVPIMFIPLLAVYISMALGKSENYRLSGWALLFAVPTVLCTALVLTNDLHRLVFSFPEGEEWSDYNSTYNYGYIAVIGWVIICVLIAFAIMVYKCRRAGNKKYLPITLIALAIIYAYIYSTGAKWLIFIAGDMTAVQCLMCTAIFESCIYCGLIQTNTGYDSLFEACTLGMQIADKDFNIHYASAKARVLSADTMKKAVQHPLQTDKNTLLKSGSIEGGYVFWQEDITELTSVLEELEENRKELAERNYLAQENYNTKLRIYSLREKNRLYDILQRQTAQQISLLDNLFVRYDKETDYNKRRRLLAMTAVVGSYIKRYGNLLFVSEKNEYMDIVELSRCFGESFANLEIMDVTCGCDIMQGVMVRTADAVAAYHAFECVLEAAIQDVRFIWLKARNFSDHIALYLEVECDTDLSALSVNADGYSFEDGVSRFILRIGKGGDTL